jgi:hypothetical protein
MHKKILAICAALVALGALAIPAAASAAVTLREHTAGGINDVVEVGKKVTALNDGDSTFKGGELSVTCTNNHMTGTVVKNDHVNGVQITLEKASFKGTKTEEKCDGGSLMGATRVTIPALTNEGGTGHWCIKNIAGEDRFEVIGANCGTASGTLTFTLEGNISCTYTRSASVTGTYTTTTTPSTLSVTGEPTFTKEAGSFLCPAEGKISIMKFNIYTDTEDNEAKSTEDPLSLDDV